MNTDDGRPRTAPPPLPRREGGTAIAMRPRVPLRAGEASAAPRRAGPGSHAYELPRRGPPKPPPAAIVRLLELQAVAAREEIARAGPVVRREPVTASAVVPLSTGDLARAVAARLFRLLDAYKAQPPASAEEERPPEAVSHRLEHALARERRRGGRVLAIAAVIVLGWAGLVPLSGAVIVAGSVVVQSSVKKVQHPTGGILTRILVRNGSKVEAGDELARLDQTSARVNLQLVARQLDEVRVRIARLKAERDGRAAPVWPADAASQMDAAEREQLLSSERDLFAARAAARRGQQELAESRAKQLEKQIVGLEAQLKSNNRQLTITNGELKGVEDLLKQRLVTLSRATALQRESAHLDGVDGQLASQIAETRAKVSETRLQALQAEQSFQSDVMRDLREVEAKEGELIERRLAAEDLMKRTAIRAPTSGTVHDLSVHTVGGVIGPAEVLMVIVPDGERLEIDARLSPDKIDQVHLGQTAHVRLSAFNQQATPELVGTVETVSADVVRDPQSNAGYFDVRIALAPEELRRLGKLQLVPGMPAEVFLVTESRTMLSYLFKPVTDQLSRMFRER